MTDAPVEGVEARASSPSLAWAVALLVVPWLVALLVRVQAVSAIALLLWGLVALPVGVLMAIDWYRHPIQRRGVARLMTHVLRGPILLLGTTAVLFGSATLIWIADNVLWERQAEFSAPLGILSVFAGLVMMITMVQFGWGLIRISVGRRR